VKGIPSEGETFGGLGKLLQALESSYSSANSSFKGTYALRFLIKKVCRCRSEVAVLLVNCNGLGGDRLGGKTYE
jgi:hypothetical protein